MTNLKDSAVKIPFNNLAAQNAAVPGLVEEIDRVIHEENLILGPSVEKFEEELAEYCGVKYAVSCGSGSDAITLALKAAGVTGGHSIATVGNTAPATIAAIRRVSQDVQWLAIGKDGNMDPEQIGGVHGAIVPVHLYGRPCNIEAIREYAPRAVIIEDAAQGIGIKGLAVHSAAAAVSFYPTKNLGALGDGGAVLTDNRSIDDRVRAMRNYGIVNGVILEEWGINSRLDTIAAAVLRRKLSMLDMWNGNRKRLAKIYSDHLPKALQREPVDGENFHLYTIHHRDRNGLQKHLAGKGIQTLIHYDPSSSSRIETVEHCRTVLSLPLWPGMPEKDVLQVCHVIEEFCS